MTKTLNNLLNALPTYEIVGEIDPTTDITDIVTDSRRVIPGALFIAYAGRATDSHRFLPDVVAKGAAVAVVEHADPALSLPQIVVPDGREAWGWLSAAWENFPSRDLKVVGVTGTDGKTTTMNLINAVMEALPYRTGMVTTIGARIGGREVDTGEHVTTPDAPIVQGFLREMVKEGMEVALLETTSHALAQHRVAGVSYDVAVVTNITHEHLDEHGSLENYRAAKAKLFAGLAGSYRKPNTPKVAVINGDDSSYKYLSKLLADEQFVYGIESPHATIRARDIHFERDGTVFMADTPIGTFPIHSPLLGRFNVYNILAAIGVGIALGRHLPDVQERIAKGIASLKTVKGRMEPIDDGQDFLAIVDFAHTPVSLENALTTAREMTQGRLFAVFGSAGLRDKAKRAMMGAIAGRLADMSVITAEDPRTERVEDISAEIAAGAESAGAVLGDSYTIIYDRASAIEWAVEQAQPGDLVIACGKGHEPSMCYGTTETPWSEHEAMRAALRKKRGMLYS
jgi:UDP-N-acetylmuramoyl-L-alanyl-D-glutamate--2,6-diaminopimelate ligase